MLEDPTQKEVEKVVQRACSSRLAYAFGQAVQLYDISRSTLDLSRAIESYNYFLVDADHGNKPNFFFSAISGLTGLLKSTRRNAIREEYRRITLDEAREEQNLGSSFDSMKDLFLMARLSEDRASVEELVDRGTVLLRNEITSDFSGFVDGLFDLFKATGDRSFLDMYESMTMTVDEKKFHPDYFDENPLIALPLFQATGDSAYIPDIIAYCESSIEKEEYRTAEAIYFEMFQLTGDKGYFDKARELLEITKERASAEKPFLNLTSLFSSLDQEISSEGAIYTAVTGETYEHGSFMPSRRIMNEAQVAARISSDVDALIRYVYVSPTQEDINSLRKNISILDEMSADDFVIRGHLFDLYQITGASEDYTRIKKSFESFAAQDSNIGRCSLLLKQISR